MTKAQRMRTLEARLRNDRAVRQWDESITASRIGYQASGRSVADGVRSCIEYHHACGTELRPTSIY